MIKKVIKKLKKVFIPKSELIEDEPKKVEKPKENYIGVVAPVVSTFDPWFSEPVKTEKAIAYEEKIVEQKKVEASQQPVSKEAENIHQKMYELATKNWTTVAETQMQGGSENFQEGPGGWNSGTGHHQFRS